MTPEEIKSLGWIETEGFEKVRKLYTKQYWDSRHGKVAEMTMLTTPHPWVLIYNDHSNVRFSGVLKTKYELSVLMEQIQMNIPEPKTINHDKDMRFLQEGI